MGADNVDAFERFVFAVPPLRIQAAALFCLSVLYAVSTFAAIRLFTPFEPALSQVVPVAVLIFSVPFFVAAELFPRILDDYQRRWSYFLALTAQLVLFVYALVLQGADNVGNAWSIIWLSVITLYLLNLLVLVVSIGIDRSNQALVLSLVEPIALITIFGSGESLGGVDLIRHN